MTIKFLFGYSENEKAFIIITILPMFNYVPICYIVAQTIYPYCLYIVVKVESILNYSFII